jgi:hypothetical protein
MEGEKRQLRRELGLKFRSTEEREYWQKVFKANQDHEEDPATAAEIADKIIELRRQRDADK